MVWGERAGIKDLSENRGRLFSDMNRQAFLLPVLIGLLQFSGWQTLAAQQRVEDEQKAGRTHFREGPEPNEIGRVELSEKQAKNANFDCEIAGPATMNVKHQH